MAFRQSFGSTTWVFDDLRQLMAKASPLRSGDVLAGVAASCSEEAVAARMLLADQPLSLFLAQVLIPYETDEVTRLICDGHDAAAFAPIASMTVGDFREFVLSDAADSDVLARLAPAVTPEMAAAVSKIMRNQDLILAASKCRVVTAFRDTIGLPGTLSVRLQPNHPSDDLEGVTASILDGLLLGSGDAVIGVNPVTDSLDVIERLLGRIDDLIGRFDIPTQSCVLTHLTSTIALIERGAPVDLVFQSISGTEAANASFGVNLALLSEGLEAARSLQRGSVGRNVMYFETGQGSALSAGAHHGLDQQTAEARAYAVARRFEPLLVNTVVGFIGP
jgi:ethanolamine ammonia-lyase large subunit